MHRNGAVVDVVEAEALNVALHGIERVVDRRLFKFVIVTRVIKDARRFIGLTGRLIVPADPRCAQVDIGPNQLVLSVVDSLQGDVAPRRLEGRAVGVIIVGQGGIAACLHRVGVVHGAAVKRNGVELIQHRAALRIHKHMPIAQRLQGWHEDVPGQARPFLLAREDQQLRGGAAALAARQFDRSGRGGGSLLGCDGRLCVQVEFRQVTALN